MSALSREHGFICNKGNHWFSIRKVRNVWYNLNSTNMVPPGAQFIGDFMLEAVMSQVQGAGWQIYLIRNPNGKELPLPDENKINLPLRKNQMYLDAAGIKTYS